MTKSTEQRQRATWAPATVSVVVGARSELLYGTWRLMIHRCFNPRHGKFKYYGARGITVCERWLDFWKFKADMPPRPEGHLLERTDNNGNYEPSNCIWALPKQQNRNKRNIKYHGLAEEVFRMRGLGIQRRDIVAYTGANVATVKAILAGRQWA